MTPSILYTDQPPRPLAKQRRCSQRWPWTLAQASASNNTADVRDDRHQGTEFDHLRRHSQLGILNVSDMDGSWCGRGRGVRYRESILRSLGLCASAFGKRNLVAVIGALFLVFKRSVFFFGANREVDSIQS
jgi:hypothetical protein